MAALLVDPASTASMDGPMATRGHERWRSEDRRIGVGIWECDAGRFRAPFAKSGEFIHVVAGRVP